MFLCNIKNIIIILALVAYVCFLIVDEIGHNKVVTDFVKEQCKYDSESRTWHFDIQWYLDENNMETVSEPKKTFSGENGLEECMKYSRDLDKEIRNLSD